MLRYEDLLADPGGAVSALVAYLGVDPAGAARDAMAASILEHTPESDRYRTTETAQASIGRWRRDLPAHLERAAQETFAPALVEFGYEA